MEGRSLPHPSMSSVGRLQARSRTRNLEIPLLGLFASWKLLLLIVVSASPGPGYDTSTRLLLDARATGPRSSSSLVGHVVLRLTRWDAIYFATSAHRGHVNEQDWAFSWALARFTSAVSSVLFSSSGHDPVVSTAMAAIAISTLSHLTSVIVLYHLAFAVTSNRRIAWVTAALHIVTPAGVFLSAPSAEATFALFNFLGMFCYAKASRSSDPVSHGWTVSAGASFGLATLMRSNGLLSGAIFAWDFLLAVPRLPEHLTSGLKFRRLLGTTIAGILVAAGFVLPQIVAYMQFCTGDQTRPWCTQLPPSIYSFVQAHYWGVGFLRYWTLSNLPLFLLAGPMCLVLGSTAKTALVDSAARLPPMKNGDATTRQLLARFALPQLILALMAITSFHVQIINRISSGYPVWYVILAAQICADAPNSATALPSPGVVVKGMVLYALIQGGLYASFLPPA